jgi:SAM-dependent methyltransferase
MKSVVAEQLIELNRKFYADFGDAFAATRRRIQPGIRQVLEILPRQAADEGCWLDLGGGGGQVAAAWAEENRTGSYLGLDFSPSLLENARSRAETFAHPALDIEYGLSDMEAESLQAQFSPASFDGVLAFASLHHVPTPELRLALLKAINRLLNAGGLFIHSEWQFHNSPRLMKRVLPWETIGLTSADVDENDFLLDWRYALPGQAEQVGLRYIHIYTREELAALAKASGFEVVFEFDSDGKEGNLALYQGWKKK